MIAQWSLCLSIVSHGQGPLVAALLGDLQRLNAFDPARDEIVLTLNIPEDETFLDAFSSLPLRVLRNSQPKGFGANHNAAFVVSHSSIFVVVNPDIRLSHFAPALMFEILSNPKVGLWAPCVLSNSGNVEDSVRRFPTVLRLARRVFLRQRSCDYSIDAEPISVDWVAGMFVALRRKTYAALGGFDERYFMYLEDADICRRIGQMHMRVIYDSRLSVVHDAQRASRRNLQHIRWHVRSAVRFLFGI